MKPRCPCFRVSRVLCIESRIRRLEYMNYLTGRYILVRGSITLMLAIGVLVALLVVGCTDSTAPDGPGTDVEISFYPAAQGQEIELTETVDFSVSAVNADKLSVNWKKRGIVISEGDSYTYRPLVLGTDTLVVQADADGYARNYYWVIKVVSVAGTQPKPVVGVGAEPGPAPGDVECTWRNVATSTYPIAEFVIAKSSTGLITDANWDEAQILRRVPNQVGEIYFAENFTVADDGMVPGEDIWLAVRAVDQAGQFSPVSVNGFTTITTAWWLTGVVVDDTGAYPPFVSVRSVDPPLATNTDGTDGSFRLGPFRSSDKVEIYTRSSTEQGSGWFDFQTVPLDSVTGKDREIVLIKRHIIDPYCTDNYNGQFLNYFRYMTRADDRFAVSGETNLWQWDSYPLRVFVPEAQPDDNADYVAAAQFVMAYWDSVMGESYFEMTDNSEAADVVFRIDNSSSTLYGKVSLLEPAGSEYILGTVKPEKVEVYISTRIATLLGAKSVMLHELGHVLGLVEHSGCQGSEHLMMIGHIADFDAEHPIHPDEQNAVRCIRRLPQGLDTSRFSLD